MRKRFSSPVAMAAVKELERGGGGSVSGSGERGCEGVREGEGVVRRGVRGDERVRGE